MNQWLEQVILGVVQGVTEWLPISSSGHLALIERVLGLAPDLSYDLTLHLASLCVLLWYFRYDVICLVKSLWNRSATNERHMIGYIVSATAVTIPIALLIEPYETYFRSLPWLAICFFINALILRSSKENAVRTPLSYRVALMLGAVQGFAAVPALSRSGLVIAAGLIAGLSKEDAFRFGFLMAIPALAGAALLKVPDLAWNPVYIVGIIMTMVAGWFSLRLLQRVVIRSAFSQFWWYNAMLGLISIVMYARGI